MNEKYTVVAETVRDNKTGLTWQRGVPTKVYTWAEAKEYAKTRRPVTARLYETSGSRKRPH